MYKISLLSESTKYMADNFLGRTLRSLSGSDGKAKRFNWLALYPSSKPSLTPPEVFGTSVHPAFSLLSLDAPTLNRSTLLLWIYLCS